MEKNLDYLDPEVERLFYQFLESLKSLGYKVFYIDCKRHAVDYIRAKRVTNEELKKGFLTRLNRDIDVLVMPTTIISAPRFDELMITDIGDTVEKLCLETPQYLIALDFLQVVFPLG